MGVSLPYAGPYMGDAAICPMWVNVGGVPLYGLMRTVHDSISYRMNSFRKTTWLCFLSSYLNYLK